MNARHKKVQTAPNSVRIIAGQWRGRRVPVLNSEGLRPTTDRVRERLFNWLMHDVAGARCLDLFAGSGALGLECLSRGAAFVQFVESDKRIAQNLRVSVNLLSQGDATDTNAHIHESHGVHFLKQVSQPFDIVFLDPPFQSDLLVSCIDALQQYNCLTDNALVYIEQAAKTDLPKLPEGWEIHREGTTGQSRYALALCSRNTV